jgi:ribulose-5-phosphate 4-epimerase/fuculose-1-phosphate aldolase
LASIDEVIYLLSFEQRFFLKNGYRVLDPLPVCSLEAREAIASAVRDCDVLIVKNHGCFSVGSTLKEAYYRVIELESAALATVVARLFGKTITLPL